MYRSRASPQKDREASSLLIDVSIRAQRPLVLPISVGQESVDAKHRREKRSVARESAHCLFTRLLKRKFLG